jgi:hypothetical protein
MFNFRLFRFRSLERNRESDERRVAFIQKIVRSRSLRQKQKRQDFELAWRSREGQ